MGFRKFPRLANVPLHYQQETGEPKVDKAKGGRRGSLGEIREETECGAWLLRTVQ